MVEKFGSDQSQLAIFGGGVITEDGAVLVSGESTGKDSLLFGPAALREIQSGIANSDFAVPPADIASNIDDASNPLPYWSVTAGSGWSAVSVASDDFFVGGNGSGRSVRVVCAPSTPLDRQISLTRITPIASNVNRAHSYYPEVYVAAGATSTTIGISLTTSYLDSTFTTISSGPSRTSSTVGIGLYAPTAQNVNMAAPSNAAYIQLTIAFTVNAVGGSGALTQGFTISECRLVRGDEALLVSELTTPGTYAPALIQQSNGTLTVTPAGGFSLPNSTLGQYDKQGSADTTTITTAGTYYALTNAEITFTPQFVGQRWMLCYSGYASLNTTTIQYCFVRANVTDTSNVVLDTLGFGRADNFGSSGRGGTVAVTKVWVADTTSARKFKLYGTVQTTNGLTLSLAYTQMTAYPIG